MIFFDPIWTNLNQFDLIWSDLIWFEPNYDIHFRLLCTNTSRPNGRRQISRELYSSTKENANLALDFWSWIGYQQTTKFNQSLKISNFKTNHHFSSTKRRLVFRKIFRLEKTGLWQNMYRRQLIQFVLKSWGLIRECVSTGAAGAQSRRSLEHHLLHPLLLRLLILCAPAVLRPRAHLHPQIQIPNVFPRF